MVRTVLQIYEVLKYDKILIYTLWKEVVMDQHYQYDVLKFQQTSNVMRKEITAMNTETWIAWLVEARFNEIINIVSFHCVCIHMYMTRDNVFVVLVGGSWSLKVVHTVYVAIFFTAVYHMNEAICR